MMLRSAIEYVRIPATGPRCPGWDGIVRQHIATAPGGAAACVSAGGNR